MKRVIIIAGPNGAGKTTFGLQYRQHEPELEGIQFLNADEIERTLPAEMPPSSKALEAGRIMLKMIEDLVERGESFIVETTLAVRWYANKIPKWQSNGYHVTLVYLRLPSADYAVKRVKQRVQNNGHDVPEETVRRRYYTSLDYLDSLYRPIVDELIIKDNEDNSGQLFAAGEADE